ncbi:MAG: FecR family protein, partial [Terriglobales bacterium]
MGSLLAALATTAEAQKAGAVDAVRPQAIIQRGTAQLSAEKGTSVSWDDLLHTDTQGRLRVQLLDQSLITLGADSQVRVIRQAPSSDQSSLELAYGKIRMRLVKQPQRFELRTATAVAGVIGTDFGADASVPGTTHFICLE